MNFLVLNPQVIPHRTGPSRQILLSRRLPMSAVIQIDQVSAFMALTNDKLLQDHRIFLELGHTKNQNKNPVAEKATQELEAELLWKVQFFLVSIPWLLPD